MKKSLSVLTCGALACGLFLAGAGVAPAEVVRTERGNLIMENVPDVPDTLANRMQQYLSIRSASVCSWLPGEKGMLIYTRFGDTTQVHKLSAPGAFRQQLTFFSEPVSEAVVNPNPARHDMMVLKDIGGNENYQLFHFDRDTGVATLISDGKSRYGTVVWNHDGSKIAYVSTQRNGKDWDVYIADPLHPESAKKVYQGQGYWSVLDWSEDGEAMLIHRYNSIVDARLELLDLGTGKTRRLGCFPDFDSQEAFYIGDAHFAADGNRVYFTSNRGNKFTKLYEQNLGNGKIAPLTANINWDVEGVKVSPDGRHLAFVVNAGGINDVYLLDLTDESRAYRRVQQLPKGVVSGLAFDENGARLAVSVNSSTSPGDVYSVDMKGADMQRWTFSEVGGLDTSKFVEPQLISYPTFDKDGANQRQIPAFVYLPKQAAEKVPVLINIHGGPESQYQPYFSSLTQYLVNEAGIAVIAPNVRGSSGYGSEYVQLDNGFKRMDSVKDIGALLDWIKTQPHLDSSRVAVMGGSYGGFMTLASLYVYNDRLSAGIDNVGISNFVTFLKNTKDYRRDLRRAEYGDERDPEMHKFLSETAPSNNAGKITKPLYVVQGANDPRVPLSEADQIVREVRSNGGDVWYLVATDEGHGFRKKANSNLYLQTVVMFLQKHLFKQGDMK